MNALARRHYHVERWHTINRCLTVGIILAILGAMVIFFIPIINKTKELKEILETRKRELQTETLLQKKQEREVRLLQSNPVYLETIARDKLDLMKPGETIFRLGSKK